MARAVPGLRLAFWTLVGNIALAALKIGGGIAFSSQAVLADGIHSLGDAAGSVAVLFGRRVAAEPPDAEHPYGHEKAESVAAFAVGVLLLAAGLSVAAEAIGRLLRGAPGEPGAAALGVAALAIAVKVVLYRLSADAARRAGSAGLLANARDSLADIWSSGAALLGVAMGRLGVRWGDPAMALAVSALLIGSGARLALDTLQELLEGRTAGDDAPLRRAALSVSGVRELHSLRTRAMGPFVLVDLKIGVDGGMSVRDGHEVARRVAAAVHAAAPAVREVLVHVNPARSADQRGEGPGDPAARAE